MRRICLLVPDVATAKRQLLLLFREWYTHPNGQLPAYEWNFGDVNPPVHAWAALKVFVNDGSRDYDFAVAEDLERRLLRLFLRDEKGRRPVYGDLSLFQNDPRWRDHILFYEYFHGDTGAGLGASHQTGWTALAGAMIANRRALMDR